MANKVERLDAANRCLHLGLERLDAEAGAANRGRLTASNQAPVSERGSSSIDNSALSAAKRLRRVASSSPNCSGVIALGLPR
jgi:hypothetical protein